jgi:hypothetical protein
MKTQRAFVMGILSLALLLSVAGGAVAQIEETPADPQATSPGQIASALAMEAWATGATEDIEVAYDPNVVMIIDDDTLAEDRDEITSVIRAGLSINTYRQVGPVAELEASDGDLYVATLVEVVGLGHPDGVPVVGFHRVRDGKVIRHVFMDAEHY